LPQERRQFAEFSIDGQSVRWTLLRGQARISFEGTRTRDDDVIRGRAEQNGVVGEFQLIRIAAGKQRDCRRPSCRGREACRDRVHQRSPGPSEFSISDLGTPREKVVDYSRSVAALEASISRLWTGGERRSLPEAIEEAITDVRRDGWRPVIVVLGAGSQPPSYISATDVGLQPMYPHPDRGRAVATLAPVDAPKDDGWARRMVADGHARWGGGKPAGLRRRIKSRGALASHMVIEDRR
jgi:hypothetical protein